MKSDKIFKVDDISTYPDGLTEIFSEYYDVIRSYFRDAKIEDYYDVHCILEVNEFWNNPKLAELKDRALAFLEDWKIRAYHNTRIRDIEEVTTQGLLLLDPENYTHKMRELLNASPFSSEILRILSLISPIAIGSIPAKGSSKSIKSGLAAKALAISNLRCLP